jgi:hypothetical protein
MAKLFDFFFRQKVTEAELDGAFLALEDADKIFAVDFSQSGVISPGMAVTEFAVPNLTLDVSAGVGYSKTGERINVTPQQNVDVSQDENGASTSVSAGNERWVQIEARFDRVLSDPRIDGNGATVNFIRAESFELAVVMGAEATTGNGEKPPVPSQHLLLVDFLMTPSKTSVVNGDLDFTRRDDFAFTTAANISVNPAGWTELSGTDVQAALDSADVLIISRNGSGDIDEDLLPVDATQDLGSATKRWAESHVQTETIYTKLAANADALPIGDASNGFSVFAALLNFQAASRTVGDILPQADDADDLGSGSLQWSNIFAVDTTVALTATARDIKSSKTTLAGAYKMSVAKAVTTRYSIIGRGNSVGTEWTFLRFSFLTRTVHQWSAAPVGTTGRLLLDLDLPDGAVLTDVDITWGQSASADTANATAAIFKVDNQGTRTQIGSSKVLGVFGSWQDDDTVVTGQSETIDRSANTYHLDVLSGNDTTGVTTGVSGFRATYDLTDIGLAAST